MVYLVNVNKVISHWTCFVIQYKHQTIDNPLWILRAGNEYHSTYVFYRISQKSRNIPKLTKCVTHLVRAIFGRCHRKSIYNIVFYRTAIYRDKIIVAFNKVLAIEPTYMMTSSNGNIFRVTVPLWGESTGPGEFPSQRPVMRNFDAFLTNGRAKNRDAGDLRRHLAQYNMTVV